MSGMSLPTYCRQIALFATLFICGFVSINAIRQPAYLAPDQQVDFDVYYVAADLVRANLDSHIYDDAGTGQDTQSRFANASTVFGKDAEQVGLQHVRLYVYPPLLADVLAPLTLLPLPTARVAWRFLNLMCLLGTAAIILRLLDIKALSGKGALVLAGLFAIKPVWICLYFGQVAIILLLLWTAATMLYVQGRKAPAAFLIAVAVYIKLTPLIFIVPMLVWRDWQWFRWFVGSMILLAALMAYKNGISTLYFYGHNVIPAMQAGYCNLYNRTLLSAIEMLGRGSAMDDIPVPYISMLFGKLLSAAIIAYAAFLTLRLGTTPTNATKIQVIAAFSLLSLCVAPVSWMHAYALAFFMVAQIWKRAFDERMGAFPLLLVVATTLSICSLSLVGSTTARFYLFAFLGPILGTVMSIYSLSDSRTLFGQQKGALDYRHSLEGLQ